MTSPLQKSRQLLNCLSWLNKRAQLATDQSGAAAEECHRLNPEKRGVSNGGKVG